jgi:hypothetical protein
LPGFPAVGFGGRFQSLLFEQLRVFDLSGSARFMRQGAKALHTIHGIFDAIPP